MNNYENYQNYEEEDEIDLGLMFKYIWKNLKWILLIGVIGVLIGGGFVSIKNRSLANDTYKSKASIYFQFNLDGMDLTQVTGIQTNLMNDYTAFVTTRPVLENAIAKENLDMTYEKLQKEVDTNIVPAHILEIMVTDEDPKTAQRLAQAVADATMECVLLISSDSVPIPLEQANLPTEPITEKEKKLAKYILIGLIAGLFVGCALFGCIYIFSDKILTDDDIRRFLHLPTIAVVKKDEDVGTALDRIHSELEFTSIELGQSQEVLDEYLEGAKLAKTGENIIGIIGMGSHAKPIAKSLERLRTVGCKVIGVVLKE